MKMKIVILAGGSGTRLWPLSRKRFPKQAQPLIGNKTLLQLTYARIKKGFKPVDIFISTGRQYVKGIKKQLPGLKHSQLIVEPVARETAAAIGLATVTLARQDPQTIIAIVNSDHFIKDEKKYLQAIKAAGRSVEQYPGYLTLLGINPTYPETGYVYFFFQAEDGIRDWSVTGVQTCALPISSQKTASRLVSDWSSDVCSSD